MDLDVLLVWQYYVCTVCRQGAQKKEKCWLELPWNTALPPVGPSVPSAGRPPPAFPWSRTNNLSIVASGQLPTRAKALSSNQISRTTRQFANSFTTNSYTVRLCSLCYYVCLTCVAPGSVSPGPASCPAGGWAPVWAVSLRSGAPTPADSASSDHSGSDSACGSPVPGASSGFLPAQTHVHTQAFSVVALTDSYGEQSKLQNKELGLQLMIIFTMDYSKV